MYRARRRQIYATEIAEFLGREYYGKDLLIEYPGYDTTSSTAFVYACSQKEIDSFQSKMKKILLIVPDQMQITRSFSIIFSPQPKLDFILAVRNFFCEVETRKQASSASVSEEAIIGNNVSIGENCIIGPDVSIGDNTVIMNNVVLKGNLILGESCIVKDNTVLGGEGYDYEKGLDGVLYVLPHIGKIIVGDSVVIGSGVTIERPALDCSSIGSGSKIDDLVHIGAEVQIGEDSMIASGSVICRKVMIGSRVWISPNVTVKENIRITDGAYVGLASLVLRNIDEATVYFGNPAKKQNRSD